MKAVDLYINSMLPTDLQDLNRPMDKKNIDALLAEVGRRYPGRYSEIVKNLSDVGRRAAYLQGETLGLDDFKPVVDKHTLFGHMDAELAAADATAKGDADKDQKHLAVWAKYSELLGNETSKNSRHTSLGRSIASGARGNALQLKAMLTTPSLYTDYKGRVIPMFIRNSFGEGLRPAEHLASSYGTRSAVISTKLSTAKGGDLLKQGSSALTPIIVTEDDCGTSNGLDYDADDKELQGRVLAREYGGEPAGTVIDKHVMNMLRKSGVKTVLARSPMTCTARQGICAHCLGTLPTGHFATKGYSAGITATHGLFEPVVQGALNCLAADTSIRMADWSTKPIETIRPGDMILGATKCGSTFPVRVNFVFYQGLQPVQNYTYESTRPQIGGEPAVITATKIHRVLVNIGRPDVLPIGDPRSELVVMNNEPDYRRVSVSDAGTRRCWDIEVDSDDSLFVLANGMIVHNSKHIGGASKGTKKQFSGFNVISQLVQSPETFDSKAPVAEEAGRVSRIEDAPQGGKFVHVGESRHYVLPGFEVSVKPGDEVEAGDQLSEGIVDASDIVRLRGLGEGRRYYADRLGQALQESGAGNPSKLNLEIMARAAIDHVKVDDPDGIGDHLPDDVVSYSTLASGYVPPSNAGVLHPSKAVGKTLHAPALHYTIGTKLTPKMTKRIQDAGIDSLVVSDEEPKFHPEMVRLRAAAHSNPDWMVRMQSSYLSGNLADAAERSLDTDVESNVHYAPRLAIGKDFGKNIATTGAF